MFHGLSLNKVGGDIGKDAGKNKDSSRNKINALGFLSGLQASATQFWISWAWHAGGFVIDHSCDHNHHSCEKANGYFVLGQHNQEWEYAKQTGKAGACAQSDKDCWQGTAYQC
jgi:hypothetical protein